MSKKIRHAYFLKQMNIMKYAYIFFSLALLTSCNSNSKKTESDKSVISSDSLTDKEAAYLKTRDAYIEQLKPFEKNWNNNSASKANSKALLELEIRIQEILKDSRYSGQGKINLETLIPSVGFGLLDGLSFEKDSMRIFYTSKNLFLNYYKAHNAGALTPENLDGLFNCAFASDAFILDFTHIKIPSTKSTEAYGMVALGGQDIVLYPPQLFLAYVSTDKYIYLIQKYLDPPSKLLPQCKAVWDSFGPESKMSPTKRDSAFAQYRKCYQAELASDPQFPAIKKQLESMVKYLEP